MDLCDTNSHKFVLLSYKLVYTNSHKFVSQERNWIMEVPLAQLVVALPLSVLSLCHYPLVLRRLLPLPLPSPRPSPAVVALCTATTLPLLPQPARCCHHTAAVALCAAAKLPPPPPPLPPLRRSLVGCCVVVCCPILSLHAVMRPVTLSLLAWTFLYELICTNSDNIHFSNKDCYMHKLYESGNRNDLKCVVCGPSSVVCPLCQLIPMYVHYYVNTVQYYFTR